MASEGRIVKPDKDFTAEVDKQLPEAEELANVRSLLHHLGIKLTASRRIYSPLSKSFPCLKNRPVR